MAISSRKFLDFVQDNFTEIVIVLGVLIAFCLIPAVLSAIFLPRAHLDAINFNASDCTVLSQQTANLTCTEKPKREFNVTCYQSSWNVTYPVWNNVTNQNETTNSTITSFYKYGSYNVSLEELHSRNVSLVYPCFYQLVDVYAVQYTINEVKPWSIISGLSWTIFVLLLVLLAITLFIRFCVREKAPSLGD